MKASPQSSTHAPNPAARTESDGPARLPRATPESVGVDSARLLAFVEALESRVDAVHGLMLLRRGQVVAEGHWAPYAAGDLHAVYSISKSFTATAVGMAVAEGLLSLHDRVLSHFPEHRPAEVDQNLEAMRVHDLLRMATGHQNDVSQLMKADPSGAWTRAFFATPVEHKPGIHFVYNSGASYVLCALVQKLSGTSVEEYLRPRLFEPLGIERWFWCTSPEGVSMGEGGLFLRTEHIAKLALLYLQKGVFDGRRLLSEAWVEQATARQVSTGGDPDGNWDAGYGYQFWRNKVAGYRADGAFGQFGFVFPEYDVVLAATGGTADTHGVMECVWQELLPAIHDAPLREAPEARARLGAKLEALTLPVVTGAQSAPAAARISGRRFTCAENELGLRALSLTFDGGTAVLEVSDADGEHRIGSSHGRWTRGRTSFQRRITNPYAPPEQGIAATHAWTSDDVCTMKLCFHESPYTITARFTVNGDELFIDLEHNVRWGERRRPRVIAR